MQVCHLLIAPPSLLVPFNCNPHVRWAPLSGAGAHALEDLLLWLCTYTDLFSRKCCATDCLLAADLTSQLLLPPLLRPYKLSPAELRDAAAYPHRRRAYHLHAAPYTLL